MKFIAFVILFLVACHFAVAQESHYHKGLRSQADNDKMGTVGVMGVSFEHYSDYKNADWAYKMAMKSGYTKAFGEYPAFQARMKQYKADEKQRKKEEKRKAKAAKKRLKEN